MFVESAREDRQDSFGEDCWSLEPKSSEGSLRRCNMKDPSER